MDTNQITKVLEYCGTPCSSFKYENPLLDKNIADLLAKGFITILKKLDLTDENNRHIVLKNIRISCKVEPSNHLHVDDNIIEVLRNGYQELPNNRNIYKDLDTFLIRNLKEVNIGSLYSPSFKPDIIQALANLNNNKQEINDVLVKDIIYWNVDSKENSYSNMLKTIWNVEFVQDLCKRQPDDVSLKIKPLIEEILLLTTSEMIETVIIDTGNWFAAKKDLMDLIDICCVSSECFQICCSILNTIFIKTQFNSHISEFITLFINTIHNINVDNTSEMYPVHLQHIVVFLDVDVEDLSDVQKTYITYTIQHLNSLHKECESDLIMLLSHFKQWFQIYYDSTNNIIPSPIQRYDSLLSIRNKFKEYYLGLCRPVLEPLKMIKSEKK